VPLLSARHLDVAPPGATGAVLRGIDLELDRGEWLALSGPNGGGKTTLALTLAGLWPARGGTLQLAGRPFGPGGDPRQRASVAVVLQDPASQLLEQRVADEIALTARNLDVPDDELNRRVAAVAERLGLASELGCPTATRSAGRQQLVVMAAALAANPALLIADEPTAHLDPQARANLLSLIRERVRDGMAVVWVTQDPSELNAADRAREIDRDGPRSGAENTSQGAGEPTDEAKGAASSCIAVVRLRSGPPAEAGPRVTVATDVEFRLEARHLVALVGPNASGKSLALRAVAGLERSTQIDVALTSFATGAPPLLASQYPEHEMFEETVDRELIFTATSRGLPPDEARAKAAHLLRQLGMEPSLLLPRRTWSLSGGERRLVQLVGALIAPAGVLCLDEPTAGLDAMRREAIGRQISLRSKDIPILIASQDVDWVGRWAGEVVELGPGPWMKTPSLSKKTD
jgi:energy-coupling factor transport system ATP-binding protein